jgi:rRNA maturation RNase YbeY
VKVDRRRLVKVVRRSLRIEGIDRSVEVSIVLTDDEEIRTLNKAYRGKDRATDVLAFSQVEGEPVPEGEWPTPLGDVVISVKMAMRQAEERGHCFDDELELLVVHGILHLLGYEDETVAGVAAMRKREKAIVSLN